MWVLTFKIKPSLLYLIWIEELKMVKLYKRTQHSPFLFCVAFNKVQANKLPHAILHQRVTNKETGK
uniref:Uncharacterized protein n=1 Tax=Rhizophora mucronata TaxID=61149 RepID=A0A2P2MYK4_RHIMU